MADLSPLSDRVVLDEAHLQAEEILAAARRQAADIRRTAEVELERTRIQIAEMRLAASRELAEAELRAAVGEMESPAEIAAMATDRQRASKYTRRSAGLPRLGTQAVTVHAAMQQLRRSSPPTD